MNPSEESDASPFRETSTESRSKIESIQKVLDRWLITPFRIISTDWRANVGLVLLSTYIFAGTIGTLIVDSPTYAQGPRNLLPFQNIEYILGTSDQGISILSQIIHSTPTILIMVTSGGIFAVGVAVFVGVLSGYKGGRLDRILMTFTDIAMTIPGLPLIIVLSTIVSVGDPVTIGILLSINSWAGLARSLRSQVMALREESYIESSRCMGLSTSTILRTDVLPNIMPYVSIHFMQSARSVIFGAVGLYFLGVLPYTEENWGTLLNSAYQSGAIWTGQLHTFLIPLTTIILFSLGLILLAQSLDAVFNPRLQARHNSTANDKENKVDK